MGKKLTVPDVDAANIDIALAVEKILYGAEYQGSVVANTPECWERVTWQDARRDKPTWDELEAAWAELSTPSLDDAKTAKKSAIDANTARIRDRDGLAYAGGRFDMRDSAMLKWTGMMAAKDMLAFPFTILTLDDKPFVLETPIELLQFLAAVMSYETAPDSPLSTGRALRMRVEAAETVEEVGVIVDDRE